MTTYKDQRDALLNEARDIAAKAKAAGRDLTVAEAEQINAKGAQITDLNDKIKVAEASSALLSSLGPLGDSKRGPVDGQKVYRDTSPAAIRKMGQAAAGKVAAKLGMKALGDPADLDGTVDILFGGQPVLEDNRSVPLLRQLIGHIATDKPKFSYVRMSPLENNAAMVAKGGLKPTSTITAEDVEGELSVLAHISSPIDEYWAKDHPEALAVYNNELVRGLLEKEELFFLHGDGQDGNPTGILNTEGILTQAYTDNLLTTTRKAVTALELVDLEPSLYVVHPADWETIELSRDTSGRLEFPEGPVNRAEHKLWGVPVALSPYLEPGKSVLLDTDAAHLITEPAIQVTASSANGDDWARNQYRVRAEQRLAVAVTHPHGIVEVSLTDA
ncbi:phage major capsid protein [Brachybacterium alimentarium]|uniref:phage major capsid protein n=1 Tax=Brachybacterium alimentarium TaxID=47845 RepID=UPI00403DC655